MISVLTNYYNEWNTQKEKKENTEDMCKLEKEKSNVSSFII